MRLHVYALGMACRRPGDVRGGQCAAGGSSSNLPQWSAVCGAPLAHCEQAHAAVVEYPPLERIPFRLVHILWPRSSLRILSGKSGPGTRR